MILLSVHNVSWQSASGDPVFEHVSFSVSDGDIVVLTGKSGSGKSTLLKCLAHLNLCSGNIEYRGKYASRCYITRAAPFNSAFVKRSPKSYGIPDFRTRVLYVPQRPSMLPGSPRAFIDAIHGFRSRQNLDGTTGKSDENTAAAMDIGRKWGIEDEMWNRDWASLSGGEAQRISLAIAVGLKGTEILLLDEPTSALDGDTIEGVEKYLKELPHSSSSTIKAIVWVTHSEEQAARIGTRRVRIENHGVIEEEHV